MATPDALSALTKTEDGLKEIKKRLEPFLHLLSSFNTSTSENNQGASTSPSRHHARAQAQAVVALSMGTLRYIGARLRGLDQGRNADDPLRQELNHMRKILVEVEKLKPTKSDEAKASDKTNATTPRSDETKSDTTTIDATDSIKTDDTATTSKKTAATTTTTVAVDSDFAASASFVNKTVTKRLVQAARHGDSDSHARESKSHVLKRRLDSTQSSGNSGDKGSDERKTKTKAKKQRKSR